MRPRLWPAPMARARTAAHARGANAATLTDPCRRARAARELDTSSPPAPAPRSPPTDWAFGDAAALNPMSGPGAGISNCGGCVGGKKGPTCGEACPNVTAPAAGMVFVTLLRPTTGDDNCQMGCPVGSGLATVAGVLTCQPCAAVSALRARAGRPPCLRSSLAPVPLRRAPRASAACSRTSRPSLAPRLPPEPQGQYSPGTRVAGKHPVCQQCPPGSQPADSQARCKTLNKAAIDATEEGVFDEFD